MTNKHLIPSLNGYLKSLLRSLTTSKLSLKISNLGIQSRSLFWEIANCLIWEWGDEKLRKVYLSRLVRKLLCVAPKSSADLGIEKASTSSNLIRSFACATWASAASVFSFCDATSAREARWMRGKESGEIKGVRGEGAGAYSANFFLIFWLLQWERHFLLSLYLNHVSARDLRIELLPVPTTR